MIESKDGKIRVFDYSDEIDETDDILEQILAQLTFLTELVKNDR